MIAVDLDALQQLDRSIDFDSFGHGDAWLVGSSIVERATTEGLAIAAAIWIGDQRVFHAALPGTSADLDQWMQRKANLVRRYDVNSWLTTQRLRGHGVTEPIANLGLDPWQHTLSGGAFPIRVHGSTVGVAVVSGIDDPTDHAIVVEALQAHAARG